MPGTSPLFSRYIGIDYSGARTPDAGLPGLRVYSADQEHLPREVLPESGRSKYWSRRGIALWLEQRLREATPTAVGIDHGFSFPVSFFERYGLRDWAAFLEDFHRHWPTDKAEMYVDFIRDGLKGHGAARSGNPRWRRIAEQRAGAKSVFHFDVPGSVAKSTHAGLPWLLYLRRQLGQRIHFWPFDGWSVPDRRSMLCEAYPALWSKLFPRDTRSQDQQDAYSIAAWLKRTDGQGQLSNYMKPALSSSETRIAETEGWILGVN
ncbi:MAG: hypothetical protein ABW076_01850 [Candidatus Thiodiazotropha sp.]